MIDYKNFFSWDILLSAAVIASAGLWLMSPGGGVSRLSGAAAPGMPSPLRQYERKLILIGVAFSVVLFGGLFAIIDFCRAYDAPAALRIALGLGWLIGAPASMRLVRVPGRLARGQSLVIHATPETVWNTVRYRETTDYYRATVARIARKSETPEIYDLHLRDLGLCRNCGLHKPPSRSKRKVTVEIVARIEGRMERTLTKVPPGEPAKAVREEINEWRIEPHEAGSLVTRSGIGVGMSLRFWITSMTRARNSSRDSLIALKSYLEGTPGTGSFAAAREMFDAAKAASRHCRCD